MGKSIVLIRFSSRLHGNCSSISSYIANYYNADNVTEYTVNTHILQPCNDCDYECLQPGKHCPNLNEKQTQIMDSICSADLVYFIVPNYCGYPSANYFAFNERSVGYYHMDRALMQKYMAVSKRFIIVSNTEGQNFTNAASQQTSGEPEILYLKTSKYQKRSIAGDILDSEDAKQDLYAFLERYSFR